MYTEVTEFLKELFLFKHNFTRIRFDVSWFKFLNHDNKMIRLVKMYTAKTYHYRYLINLHTFPVYMVNAD